MSGHFHAAMELLARHDRRIARAVESAAPDPRLVSVQARSGHTVVGLREEGGTRMFHSVFDPLREARAVVDACETPAVSAAAPASPSAGHSASYILCLGLGAGYHVSEALARPATERVLVVERDAGLLRGLLERVDLVRVLQDHRVRIALCPDPSELGGLLASDYLPALRGALGEVRLRGREESEPAYFSALRRNAAVALEGIRDDFAVQARFGRRWFRNALDNLPAIARAGKRLPEAKRVAVVAAGPSLDDQWDSLRRLSRDCYVLVADTALPPVLRRGLRPDAAISIDCQHVGYHHFRAVPGDLPVFLDVCSPPAVTRRVRDPVFLAGGHPFSAYMAATWRPLPRVDTSGGNVAHAAVSLACASGAREIRLLGVDLCYPRLTPYAAGTYLHDWFASRAGRVRPTHGELWRLCADAAGLRRWKGFSPPAYTSGLMRAYRDRLLRLLDASPAPAAAPGPVILQEPGRCPPLDLPGVPRAPTAPAVPATFGPARAPASWTAMLCDYLGALEAVDLEPMRRWDAAERSIVMTVLPVAAWVRRFEAADHREALHRAGAYMSAWVRRALETHAA